MPHESFHDLFVDELRDLWSAEKQLLTMLPRMAKAASTPQLRKAFTTHERQTEQHVKRIEGICKALDVSPRGKRCVGMDGLLSEGKELLSEDYDGDVLDAGLIAAAQRAEHYEIAAYGTARTWARQLGYDDHAAVLQQTLEEEAATDEKLTELAGGINADADAETDDEADGDEASPGKKSSGQRRSTKAKGNGSVTGQRAKTDMGRRKTAAAASDDDEEITDGEMDAEESAEARAQSAREFQPGAPLRDTRPGKKPK